MRSLLTQAAVTLALVVGFGLSGSGFEKLVIFTTPVFWFFFLLVGVTLVVLRYRDPQTPRPYRVPWYSGVPIVFCLSSLFMLYGSLSYAYYERSAEALWSIGIMAVGVVVSWFDRR